MAGRSEARVFTSIWRDPDFRRLPWLARTTYLFLIAQPDLAHCGVIPLRVERWADNMGRPADEVAGDLRLLEDARFVVTDRVAGELLVRSLVRRDKVLRQPFLFQPLADSATGIVSARLRAVLAAELGRVRDEGDVNSRVASDLDDLIRALSAPDPGADPGRHPDTHSDTHSGRHPDTHPGRQQGEGERNGGSITGPPPPYPLSPSPRGQRATHRPAGSMPLWPAAVPSPEGEGDEGQETRAAGTPAPGDLDALIAEVRAVRPDWTRASIRRAVTAPECVERGWARTRRAVLVMAADPATQQPGRLPHNGPWWHAPPARAPTRPDKHCPRHLLDYPPDGECRGCAGDRKGAATA